MRYARFSDAVEVTSEVEHDAATSALLAAGWPFVCRTDADPEYPCYVMGYDPDPGDSADATPVWAPEDLQ